MTFEYYFERQSGPSHYSEQTDECFCDTEPETYDYCVSYSDIIDALLIYNEIDTKLSAPEQAKIILKNLEGADLTDEDYNRYLKEVNNLSVQECVHCILNDSIEYYITDDQRDFIKDYCEGKAYDEWQCS